MHSNASRTFEVQLKRITRVISLYCLYFFTWAYFFKRQYQTWYQRFLFSHTYKHSSLNFIICIRFGHFCLRDLVYFFQHCQKNESLTTHWEVFQGFRFFGKSQTSHDSKNRCVTWLQLDLDCIISQSVSRSTCARRHEHCTLSPQGPLSWCWSHFDCFHVLWEIVFFSCGVLVVEVLAAAEGAFGGGGVAVGQLFPISARVMQSASRGLGERQGETQRSENTSN